MLASTASNRKIIKIKPDISWFYQKIFFSKHQKNIKISWIHNLDDSEVFSSDFWAFRNFCSLIDLISLCNLTGLLSLYSPISSNILLILMIGSSLAPNWPIRVPFCVGNNQKSNFQLIYEVLSVRGCWGQPMLLFWKLVDETQNSKPPEATRHHNSSKFSILPPLRAI